MGGASGGSSSSQQSTGVPGFQKKYLKELYSRGQQVSLQPLEYYPGQSVADFDPLTLQAQQLTADRALAGSPLLAAAQEQNLASVRGDYLSPESNPYLRSTYDQAAQAVGENFNRIALPGIESRFARAGQLGSSQLLGARQIATESLGRSLGELATNIYGGAYDAERGRQESAARFAPELAAEDYRNLDALSSVGAQREQQQQRLIDDLIARFEFGQQEPYNRLARFSQLLGNPITVGSGGSSGNNFGFNIAGTFPGL